MPLSPPRSPPARLTASATLKLPRWGLLLLCLLYILPGLIGRDLWKQDEDAAGFGVMWTMAKGSLADWLMPNVMGQPVFGGGTLMYWLGAASIKALGVLSGGRIDPIHAARLAIVLFFLLATTALWYATYLLGRRPAAQPLALAFGGQPEPQDYGRVLADGALLILLATIGLVMRSHEDTSDVATLSMLTLALYGMARSLEYARRGALWVGVGLVGLFLARGPVAALAIGLLWIILTAFFSEWRHCRRHALMITLPVALVGLAIWPLLLVLFVPQGREYLHQRLGISLGSLTGINAPTLLTYARDLPWFLLPAGPLALWGIWSWRRMLRSAHIVLPLGFVVAIALVLLASSDATDSLPFMLLPGTVILAAFALPTLKRGAANAIDWFSLMMYSLMALGIWFSWGTRFSGVPVAYAHSIARQVPGLPVTFPTVGFTIAVAVTIGWFWLVHWRIVKHPRVLWRSVVLASGGITLLWTLLMTLFVTELNYTRSYRDVALRLAQAVPEASEGCVTAEGVGLAQRASFGYFASLHYAPTDLNAKSLDDSCRFFFRQDLQRSPRDQRLPDGHWRLRWEGRRQSDRSERYRLYEKVSR